MTQAKTDNEQQITNDEPQSTDFVWWLGCAVVTSVATFLRFFILELKPLHHDEGVNGFFLTNLFREGVYKYDPANYHGPTLYYISLAFTKLFGLETLPIRWSVAVFGVATVILAFFLRRYIGRIGSIFAALFLALSPGMVFISRYFIHEIFFIFLSLAMVLAVVLFIEREKAGPFAIGWTAIILLVCFFPSTISIASVLAGENSTSFWAFTAAIGIFEAVLVFFVLRMLMAWRNGRPVYLILAASCVSLLFATKETAFITLGTMLIACGCVWLWRKMTVKSGDESFGDEINDGHLNWTGFRNSLGGGIDLALVLIASAAMFVYLTVLFFSSFFSYPEGVQKAFEAYAIWTKTGSKDHTQSGWFGYLWWAWEVEAPILILSAIGTFIAFIKARHRFAMFSGLWAFGLFAAYSIIPYKTPWLMLSFLLPMCIAAGYAINELAASKHAPAKAAAAALAIAACAVLGYQTYQHNFVRYDDEDMPYVYAHTSREFHAMTAEIERYAEKSGKGKDAAVQIVSPDYWPMVWYMRDYPKAIFHARLADADGAEMIVAKKSEQDAEVIRRYSSNYRFIRSYHLRSGVDLVLLVRKDLADADAMELYKIQTSN